MRAAQMNAPDFPQVETLIDGGAPVDKMSGLGDCAICALLEGQENRLRTEYEKTVGLLCNEIQELTTTKSRARGSWPIASVSTGIGKPASTSTPTGSSS
jgi:hypothetical protein